MYIFLKINLEKMAPWLKVHNIPFRTELNDIA